MGERGLLLVDNHLVFGGREDEIEDVGEEFGWEVLDSFGEVVHDSGW